MAMDIETIIMLLFMAPVALFIGSFLYRIFKHGGFKAAFFGASIQRTVGEVTGRARKIINVSLRVHELGGGADRAVGVEYVAKGFASYQMMPITLSKAEANKLIRLLESAVGVKDS